MALQSWCWRGGEPEPKKEEEMGALVIQRQSHAQAWPRLEKAYTSISTHKKGKEKHPQRWQMAPLPLPTLILNNFLLLSLPSLPQPGTGNTSLCQHSPAPSPLNTPPYMLLLKLLFNNIEFF